LHVQGDESARLILVLSLERWEIGRRGGEIDEIERRPEVAAVVADVADQT
jgi:hypothetical protein